jgi:hypothetical protein
MPSKQIYLDERAVANAIFTSGGRGDGSASTLYFCRSIEPYPNVALP